MDILSEAQKHRDLELDHQLPVMPSSKRRGYMVKFCFGLLVTLTVEIGR